MDPEDPLFLGMITAKPLLLQPPIVYGFLVEERFEDEACVLSRSMSDDDGLCAQNRLVTARSPLTFLRIGQSELPRASMRRVHPTDMAVCLRTLIACGDECPNITTVQEIVVNSTPSHNL